MQIIRFCKKYLLKFKYHIFCLLGINIILMGVKVFNTYLIGNYIDLLVSNSNIYSIYKYTGLVLIIHLINIILSNVNTYYSSKLQTNIVFEINASILKHIKKLPLKFFNNMDTVYLNQRINGDCNIIVSFTFSIILDFITKVLTFCVVIVLLIKESLFISIISLITIPIYIGLYLRFRNKLYDTNYECKEEQGKFFSYMHDQLTNVKFIKTNALFEKLDKDLLDRYPTFLSAILKNLKLNCVFSSLGVFIQNFFDVFLYLYAGIQILKGNMTIGSFIIIKNYYTMILESVSNIIEAIKIYPDTLVSHNRIMDILNVPKESNGASIIKSINSIELKDVTFSYNGKNILEHFSYIFNKSNVYLIRGYNGVGKSTLINILLGLYIDDYRGSIYYNGKDIRFIDLYDVRKKIVGVLEQEPILLNMSLRDNLVSNLETVQNDTIYFWINKLNMIELQDRLDKENDCYIKVSGGEKQKIALTRMFLKDADVVIMDEPTSALDVSSTKILVDVIKEIKKDKIILLISHDKSLNCCADYILDL